MEPLSARSPNWLLEAQTDALRRAAVLPQHLPIGSYPELSACLASQIGQWLAHQPQRFFQLCYRLDLPEARVQHLLRHAPQPAEALAQVMLQRLESQLLTRRRYGAG